MRAGMVFQQFNLFSDLTVCRRHQAPLVVKKCGTEKAETVARICCEVGLATSKWILSKPASGGQQQRVAVRARGDGAASDAV